MQWFITRVAVLLVLPVPLEAQSLAARLAAVRDGPVHLSFASRPGVCSSGGQGITVQDGNEDDEWESDCERGPIRVSLRMRNGRVTSAETRVGGRWKASSTATDLGMVSAPEAAALLLELAPAAGEAGEDLVSAATLADSAIVWPTLLRLAKDPHVREETRRQAVFWLGQAAGAQATRGLDSIVRDNRGEIEVRKQAVFALSQRPTGEAVPALIRIARTSREPEILKSALFWLGQSDDPRALGLFEEILR